MFSSRLALLVLEIFMQISSKQKIEVGSAVTVLAVLHRLEEYVNSLRRSRDLI